MSNRLGTHKGRPYQDDAGEDAKVGGHLITRTRPKRNSQCEVERLRDGVLPQSRSEMLRFSGGKNP